MCFFFLRDELNDPLFLEDLFGNLTRILPLFHGEKTQEQKGRHVVFKCKEDEFEVIGVISFGFMEDSLDVLWL